MGTDLHALCTDANLKATSRLIKVVDLDSKQLELTPNAIWYLVEHLNDKVEVTSNYFPGLLPANLILYYFSSPVLIRST